MFSDPFDSVLRPSSLLYFSNFRRFVLSISLDYLFRAPMLLSFYFSAIPCGLQHGFAPPDIHLWNNKFMRQNIAAELLLASYGHMAKNCYEINSFFLRRLFTVHSNSTLSCGDLTRVSYFQATSQRRGIELFHLGWQASFPEWTASKNRFLFSVGAWACQEIADSSRGITSFQMVFFFRENDKITSQRMALCQ